ncbi:MAG TPA: hypothetical protein VIR57_03285 [Chloroflexota bacterium]
MPDGIPAQPAPDTQQLLKLMSRRSEVLEMRLAAEPESRRPAIEELPPAAPSVLDELVQARVRTEEQALAAEEPSGLAAPLFADPVLEEEEPASVERLSTLEPEDWTAEEEETSILAAEEPAVDLLELNAAEAGQPVEIEPLDLPSFDASVVEEEGEPQPLAEQTIERDELPAQPRESLTFGIEQTTTLVADEPTDEDDLPIQISEEEQLPVAAIEELREAAALEDPGPEPELEPEAELESEPEPEDDVGEGPGQDFQTLLAGARQLAPEADARLAVEDEDVPLLPAVEDEEVPLLPADGDVKLRARNGPKPGAEFVGKSTLAGASGLYCLIERFNLPAGTRMKVTLTVPRSDYRFDIQDAIVKRVRRAPANSTEVQLAFEQRHEDFEDFVARHFGDRPVGFSLFTRRRPKH